MGSIYDKYTKEQWRDRCLTIERRMDQLEVEIRRLKMEKSKLRLLSDKQWQPIATAPKDGTPILGYDGYGLITSVFWRPWADSGYWSLCEAGSFAEDSEVDVEYWMLLPEKPEKPVISSP